MEQSRKMKFKKGAASFYIVAFATLILMIIATSFAAIIISEVTRTSNDDLSQSAYDSALAGVEDAKLAFYNYNNCVSQGATAKRPLTAVEAKTCDAIVLFMENGMNDDEEIGYHSCDMVSMILGRVALGDPNDDGTMVQESSAGGNNMMQYYTCTKIMTSLRDYRATLSSSQEMRVVKVKFDGVDANDIESVRLSWYSDANAADFKYTNFNGSDVVYPNIATLTKPAVPPTVYLGMVQASDDFELSDFDVTRGEQTNRGMIYMTPTNDKNKAGKKDNEGVITYDSGYDSTKGNYIDQEGMLKSNDKTTKNLPYLVYCPEDSGNEFACTVEIQLPKPIGGTRSNDNFVFVMGLPYGKPNTDFAMEFYCGENNPCNPNWSAEDRKSTRLNSSHAR